MSNISPADVKKLRDITGSGMLDCKNALVEAAGDFEEAQKILRKKGLAAATKREGRATNEGKIFIAVADTKAVILELTCETYFVATNEVFNKFGNEIAELFLQEEATEITPTIDAKVKEAISIIKENMTIKKFNFVKVAANEKVYSYSHGGQIAAIVKLTANDSAVFSNPEVEQFGSDAAMNVTAYAPMFLSAQTVSEDYKKTQLDVFTDQAKKTGKPENVIQGIVMGKLNKHYAEICLMQHGTIKDEKISLEKVLADINKKVGATITVEEFHYYKVGQ